jgi:hypothetical protein
MEPEKFCSKWLSLETTDPTFRGSCIQFLEETLFGFYTASTIERKWGTGFQNCPKKVVKLLGFIDNAWEVTKK